MGVTSVIQTLPMALRCTPLDSVMFMHSKIVVGKPTHWARILSGSEGMTLPGAYLPGKGPGVWASLA